MTYDEFLQKLSMEAEEEFAAFQRRLIPTKQRILGVRTPKMRVLAKKYLPQIQTLLSFPDEVYEVTFIKLTAVSLLPYEDFVKHVSACVAAMDNWASCDCFKPKRLTEHKEEFLPYLEAYFQKNTEFSVRFVLVILLGYYLEERYLPTVLSYVHRTDASAYYVHMALAWLVAELLVRFPDTGKEVLKSGVLDARTHNKAIQKAKESFRISSQEKAYLETLKIKKKVTV